MIGIGCFLLGNAARVGAAPVSVPLGTTPRIHVFPGMSVSGKATTSSFRTLLPYLRPTYGAISRPVKRRLANFRCKKRNILMPAENTDRKKGRPSCPYLHLLWSKLFGLLAWPHI
ncbi:hypothetical protein BDV97DRAFT_350120 [Delphinella strobiligena]|nr:hypothetical protein BDV97DRAFT_350120 [Delphinella strobiligena]